MNLQFIEKVNPAHPDKVADRIAGALVDLAYKKEVNPKIAVEVLIGHGVCHIIAETSVQLNPDDISSAVIRITEDNSIQIDYQEVPQDVHLANNQTGQVKCGDNGIFKGVPLNAVEKELSEIAREIYEKYPTDGKYILTDNQLIICQSNADSKVLLEYALEHRGLATVNPLGDWTGGTDVDTGATNRKLGSDMAQSVTGGGLHGKDTSKADVSVNIACFLKAQESGQVVTTCCAIGDTDISFHYEDGSMIKVPYAVVVNSANNYIKELGGFEKFAEWGLY